MTRWISRWLRRALCWLELHDYDRRYKRVGTSRVWYRECRHCQYSPTFDR